MNELFFSAMFIGSLLFGNPEINETLSTFNSNQSNIHQPGPKGTIDLISNSNDKLAFKISGDQNFDSLELYINDQKVDCTIKNGEFFIEKPIDNDNHSYNLELRSVCKSNYELYANYLISF